jgi:hypothetical protein
MSRLTLTTSEVVAFRGLGRHVDERWPQWALEMIEAGAVSGSLGSLAALCPPFNAFEMPELVDSSLRDMGVQSAQSVACAVRMVISIRATQILAGKMELDQALSELASLYEELIHPEDLQDFWLLHLAKQDLIDDEDQWYWPSATRGTIDQIIVDRCRAWLSEYPLK